MYKIERMDYGYKLTFAEFIQENDMRKWVEESKAALKDAPASFGVFVDMRTLKPLAQEAKAVMEEGQKLYKMKGMVRSVVILASSTVTMQFKHIAKDSGIYEWERYVSEADHPDWEAIGVKWVKDGIDPDK